MKTMRKLLNLVAMCLTLNSFSQQVIPLYNDLPLGSLDVKDMEAKGKSDAGRDVVRKVTNPTLTVFIPGRQNASRTAVIICPGGGYLYLSIEDGGYEAAKKLAASGITAFVLKYRTWRDSAYTNYTNAPMMDLQQAMKIVYTNAKEWNIDTSRVGIMGFSAGGHLATMAATSANGRKPAFTILAYPVISFMDSLTSKTSKTRNTLLGKRASLEDKIAYSPELHISSSTPPAFLVHAQNDSTSPVANSIVYYNGLIAHKIPAQLLVYQKGGHGFALYNKAEDKYWLPQAIEWLAVNGFYQSNKK
ncbi:MAG TPA: alpha/beta hydrolase [Chitinophagaceae bacterium]